MSNLLEFKPRRPAMPESSRAETIVRVIIGGLIVTSFLILAQECTQKDPLTASKGRMK